LTAGAVGSNGTGVLSSASVGGPFNFPAGQLNTANANQVDSNVSVEWTLNSIVIGSPAAFFFNVVQNNVGTPAAPGNKIEAFLDNVSLGFIYATTNTPGNVSFALSAGDIANLATAGTLFRVELSGDEGWDRLTPRPDGSEPFPGMWAPVGRCRRCAK
jgi:hypothetical protein